MLLRTWIDKAARRIRKATAAVRQHSLLLPMAVSFLCFTGSVLLILSIWFTSNVTLALKDALYTNATQSSSQSVSRLNASFQNVANIAAHLAGMEGLAPRARNFYETYSAYQTLKEYSTSFNFTMLAIYYDGNPKVLSIEGTKYLEVLFPEVTQLDALTETLENAGSVSLLSTSLYGADWGSNRVILLYPLSSRHVALFLFDHSMLSSFISPSEAGGVRVLFDRDGAVLWSSERMDEDMGRLLFARAPEADNHKEIELQGIDYIYSCGYVFYGNAMLVTLDEITTQFDELRSITGMMIAVCIVILLLGTLLLLFSIRRGYMPIAHLVRDIRGMFPAQEERSSSDIAMLQQVYSQYSALLQESRKNAALFSTGQLRTMFVLHVISGRYLDAQELRNLFQWLEIDFPHPCFFACLLLFDRMPAEYERKLIEEYLEKGSCSEAVALFNLLPDGHSAVGIVNVPSADSGHLRRFGERMLALLPAGLSATIGMGQIRGDIASLGKSYLEAHAALDYRLIKGRNTWISYDEINFSSTAPAYPRQIINSYISALHAWDVEGIQEKLQQIAAYISENSLPLQQVKCICFDLTSSFLREVSCLDNHVTYKMNASYDVFNIAEYDSVSELVQKISGISENIRQYLVKCDYQGSELVSQCIHYLQENVSNVQFSLSSCSERFGIAPQTLRRKFKEATGQTLSSYMTALRINHAKELLVTTNLDVNEICVQCGYLDLSSFIRLFKSEMGVSPGRFREMNKVSAPEAAASFGVEETKKQASGRGEA